MLNKIHKKYLSFLIFIFLSIFSQAETKTHFTIAIDPEYIPFTQKDIDGEATGLLVDFWDLWAKTNNYSVEYKFYSWKETLEAVKKGEVDFHSGATNDRDWMYASDAIYQMSTTIFTLKKNPVNTLRDLMGKRIGAIDAYYGDLVQKVIGSSIEIVIYDDYAPIIEGLKNGEIDGFIDDAETIRYYLIKTGKMNKVHKVELKELQFTNKIYAITNKKNSEFLDYINKGLKNINLIDLVEIEEIWLSKAETAYYNRMFSEKIQYTPKEQAWIKKQKELTITGDPLWDYYEDSNHNEKYRGFTGDYVEKFSENLELNLTIKSVDSWAEVLATNKIKRADIVIGMMNGDIKKLLEEYYTFLTPYEVAPLVIIMDKNVRFVTDLHDIEDTNIGMISLQNYTNEIEYRYESYSFSYYASIKKLMGALSNGKIEAVILPLPEAISTLANSKYEMFDIIGKMDKKIHVHMGVLKNKPQLFNIMKKVTQSISVHEKKKILTKWTRKLNYIEKVDYRLTYTIATILLSLLFFVLYYNYILNQRNKKSKEHSIKLELLAQKDELTGLMNKRAFNKNFEDQRHIGTNVGLLFIDVDYFKNYNDFYGHLEGDRGLRKIADILTSFQSDNSLLYRVGGEEFGMILYNYDEASAKNIAQKICSKIAAAKIKHQKSPFGIITVSIGVTVGANYGNRHNLYITSDRALYMAKMLGKNRIYFKECNSCNYSSL